MKARFTLKKGDTVLVTTGKSKGQQGVVERALPAEDAVVVAGVNLVTRHYKKSASRPQGALVRQEAPLHRSKVMPVCPHCSKATRVEHKVEGETKFRSCKHCHGSLDSKE